jgi:hypothetical protein
MRWPASLDAEQFNLEYQCGIGGNDRGSALAVGQLRWNQENEYAADRHQLEPFFPALDDLAQAERDGFVLVERCVEYDTVEQQSAVMNADPAVGLRLFAGAGDDGLVLEPRRGFHGIVLEPVPIGLAAQFLGGRGPLQGQENYTQKN